MNIIFYDHWVFKVSLSESIKVCFEVAISNCSLDTELTNLKIGEDLEPGYLCFTEGSSTSSLCDDSITFIFGRDTFTLPKPFVGLVLLDKNLFCEILVVKIERKPCSH